jgi:hypothetical protein
MGVSGRVMVSVVVEEARGGWWWRSGDRGLKRPHCDQEAVSEPSGQGAAGELCGLCVCGCSAAGPPATRLSSVGSHAARQGGPPQGAARGLKRPHRNMEAAEPSECVEGREVR